MLSPPTPLQEDTIHNILRTISILRPRSQDILPRWHLSVVLKGLMKPPFARDGSDRNISFELLSYKTAFPIALATGSLGSELFALSKAEHNIIFSELPSGAKHVSIRMVPKFIPKNARPDIIPKPLEFPGIAHLFGREPECLLCPVRIFFLGLYLIRSAELAEKDVYNPLSTLGCWNHPPDLWKLFGVRPSQDQGAWCQGSDSLHSLLQEHSLERAVWANWMEVLERLCPPLPPGHGGRYRTSGHPSSGRRNSLVMTGSFSS